MNSAVALFLFLVSFLSSRPSLISFYCLVSTSNSRFKEFELSLIRECENIYLIFSSVPGGIFFQNVYFVFPLHPILPVSLSFLDSFLLFFFPVEFLHRYISFFCFHLRWIWNTSSQASYLHELWVLDSLVCLHGPMCAPSLLNFGLRTKSVAGLYSPCFLGTDGWEKTVSWKASKSTGSVLFISFEK